MWAFVHARKGQAGALWRAGLLLSWVLLSSFIDLSHEIFRSVEIGVTNFVNMIVNHLKAPQWGEEMKMAPFMTEDFLRLDTEFARRLYRLRQRPADFRLSCHLPPQQIAKIIVFKTCMTSG